MLKFVSTYLALSYLAFATVGLLGLLQVLAAWRGLVGFSLLDYRKAAWRRALGPVLIVAAYAWFFGTRREILTPGPAGAELTLLFGCGVLLALAVTLLLASILHPHRPQRGQATLSAGVVAEHVRLDQGRPALLLARAGTAERRAAVCVLADPGVPPSEVYPLASALTDRYVVLVPVWEGPWQSGAGALTRATTAVAFLGRHPLVDESRLAVGGVGLGADLALRVAAETPAVRAVFALAPLVDDRSASGGLGLLSEMTYAEAVRWGLRGRRRPLLRGLDAAAAVTKLGSRPALVLYGSRDAVVPQAEIRIQLAGASPRLQVQTVAGEGHRSAPGSPQVTAAISQWLAENLPC